MPIYPYKCVDCGVEIQIKQNYFDETIHKICGKHCAKIWKTFPLTGMGKIKPNWKRLKGKQK